MLLIKKEEGQESEWTRIKKKKQQQFDTKRPVKSSGKGVEGLA